MLKLKYLFNNEDLAEMLLGNWKYDKESIEMFKYYRISSNAIYPFQSQGKTQLLRFAPIIEKNKENILAELDFISYLRHKQYGVLEAVNSKIGEELVKVNTPWGEYYASVFKRVAGTQFNQTDFSDNIIFSLGKALGKLHQLSNEYEPKEYKRWSYSDVLYWIQDKLDDFPNEKSAWLESKILQEFFSSVPITKNNFGLIHYDFEYDNVFYDEMTMSCNVIDFDDAMYHWYVMDIEQTLDSFKDYISSEMFQQKKQCFMDGYLTEYNISNDMFLLMPACRRFANLYSYVRCLTSLEDNWGNEPQWMKNLRENINKDMKKMSSDFGSDIVDFSTSQE
ncbi:phosphotransferase enzyme family protein [Chengkuizengella axinellae]|uniref:Phosphotransferase n=1 Tax=Chengkuizengella axinellae TaxID=3064388 RepID=A0ABT9J6E7_9BACL|nr:phosphotransferase [Chengkuizengella sp. 2205SS18-9]MDP5277196.1 phosphotransferase [Chengkuizengella sp. 2205SS18-9]